MKWLLVLLLAGCATPIRSTGYPEDIRHSVSRERYPRHGWSSPHMAYPGPPAKGPNGKVHI